MSMTTPNLFVFGAPKCGTTSLAAWLSEHPNVFMSPVKEPNFFNNNKKILSQSSWEKYEKLFIKATKMHSYLAEASPEYFRSPSALSNIIKYTQQPKFIVSIRNPIELAVSWHGQRLKEGLENETDFSKAWALQQTRTKGMHVPILCLDASKLLYGPMAKLSVHIERLFSSVNRENVLVLILDDIKINAQREYQKIINFLCLLEDKRTTFPIYNEGVRVPKITSHAIRIITHAKRLMRIQSGLGLVRRLEKLSSKPKERVILPADTSTDLREYFRPDIERLSFLLDRDFSDWLS